MAVFGKTSSGSSNTLHNANRKILSQAVLTEDAVLTSMTIRARANNTSEDKHWKPVIYSDNAGEPDALLHTGAEGTISSTSVASYTANFSGESLSAGTYWIGYIHDGNGTTSMIAYRDNNSDESVSNTDDYSDGPSSPYGFVASLGGPIDCYVTYSPQGAPEASNAFLLFFS